MWIDDPRSFRALLPSADQRECVSVFLPFSLSPIACEQGKTAAYSAAALEEYQKHRVVLSRYLLAWAIGSASGQRGPLKRSFKASRMFNLIMLKWIYFISFSYANPHSYGPVERIVAAAAEIVPVSGRDSLHIYRARDELLATLLFVLNKINREIRQSAVSAISFWP